MKKTIIGLMLLLPFISFASLGVDLKYGSRGNDVIELQEFLIDKGFLTGTATGNFYSLTKKAVISYQGSVGLPQTGYVGPLTRAEINKDLAEDTSAEIAETGTVSPVVDNSMQKQLDDLLKQVAQLIAQQKALADAQKAATNETNLVLGSIQTAVTPAPAPAPAPVVVAPSIIPTYMEVAINKANGYYPDYPYGYYSIQVTVLDQNKNLMTGQTVKLDNSIDAFSLQTPSTIRYAEDYIKVTNPTANFAYYPSVSGLRILTFTSGNLSTTTSIIIQ